MKERMILKYRNFSDEEIQAIVKEIQWLTFQYLGRTIEFQIQPHKWWQFWNSRLSLLANLTTSNRDGWLSQLHFETLTLMVHKVPLKETAEYVITVDGKVKHTAAVRTLSNGS